MKALLLVLGLLLAEQLVTLQARTLHAPTTVWAGEEDAAQMISKLPVVLRGKRPADLDADAAQLAGLLMTYPGAFKYRGLARNAPAAFLAVASEIQLHVTHRLLNRALTIIAEMGKLDLLLDVVGTFISTPDPATGEGNACGKRLVEEVAPLLPLLLAGNYTEAVKELLNKIVNVPDTEAPGSGAAEYLGTCAPDLAAVLLALAGMKCPLSGYLVAPTDVAIAPSKRAAGTSSITFSLKNVSCIPEHRNFESSVGPLLGAALMSELLLNSEEWLVKDGRNLAFAMVRMAFTVLQSNSYANCLEKFAMYERKIPRTTFPLAYPIVEPDYNLGPLMLESTVEGAATLCYATALISFKDGLAPEEQPWRPSAMVQVLVNTWLALGREMRNSTTSKLTQVQFDTLCDSMHHILRFRGNPDRTKAVDMFLPDQYQCIMNPTISPCPPEASGLPALESVKWFKRIPKLAAGHDLSSELFACQVAA